MSLATTCPQCRTSFKVVPDQLKLRRGQVRCGVCQHVFSGLDSLRYVQADSAAPTPTRDTTTTPAAPIAIRSGTSASIDDEARPQADPYIDIDSITSSAPREPHDTASEPTLESPTAREEAPATGDDAPSAQEEVPAVADAAASADSETGLAAEPDWRPPAGPDTEALPDRETEVLADEPDTQARDTLPLDDAGNAFDTLARDLGSAGEPATPSAVAEPSEPSATVASTADMSQAPTSASAHTPAPAPVQTPAPGPATESASESAPAPSSADERSRLRAAHAQPASDGAEDDETVAVDFFSTQRNARGFSTRGTLIAAFASILLAALLAAQAAIGARDWLVARYPALRPAISAAVGPLGLEIEAPRSLDSLTIEGFELQSTPVAGLYSMNALLRNGADHDVRWPAMELTLNDRAGAVIVRKVLMPADYLPGASVRSAADPGAAPGTASGTASTTTAAPAAIAPAAEVALRTALDASGIEPTGYTVKLFYP